MRIYRFIVFAICLCFIPLSCKRTGREVAEKISVELTERSAKELVDKGAEKSLKTQEHFLTSAAAPPRFISDATAVSSLSAEE